jgi:hypothetical protein
MRTPSLGTIGRWIKRSKRLFNKAFIKKIPFSVSLNHGIVLLLPGWGQMR